LDLSWLVIESVDLVDIVENTPERSDFVLKETSLNWEYSLYHFHDSIYAFNLVKWIVQDCIGNDEDQSKNGDTVEYRQHV
jgi:hypothetical protein